MNIRDAAAVPVLALAIPAAIVIWDVQVDNHLERWQGSRCSLPLSPTSGWSRHC